MGVSGQHHTPDGLFPPGKGPPVPLGREAVWALELIWTQRLLEEKSFASVRDRTSIALCDRLNVDILVGYIFILTTTST
jgi:hypothetical protein